MKHLLAAVPQNVARGLAGIVLMLLVGCTSSDNPQLYLLAPIRVDAAPTPAAMRDLPVGLAPVTVPEYLDRPDIMQRAGGTEIKPIGSARWAERLSINVGRVVAENLGLLLGSGDVVQLPTRSGTPINLEVALDLSRFEQDSDGTAVLAGRWTVRRAGNGSEVASGRTSLREPVEGSGTDQVVAAMSRNLAKVSRDIATGINRVPVDRRQASRIQ